MKKLFPVFAVFGLLVLLFGTGCATLSLPLTETEKAENRQALSNCSDSMQIYTELQKSAGTRRIPISVKVINDPHSNNLQRELVKSRAIIPPLKRIRKFIRKEPITRDDLDIRTDLY